MLQIKRVMLDCSRRVSSTKMAPFQDSWFPVPTVLQFARTVRADGLRVRVGCRTVCGIAGLTGSKLNG
jgi:hypothetical protein